LSLPPGRPWRAGNNGVTVMVRLTPKSSRDDVVGIEAAADGPRLAVRVRALPDKGEANAALLVVLAKWLGVPKSRLELIAGATSRAKTVAVSGPASELVTLLENLTK
jgi:uncharacterized protein